MSWWIEGNQINVSNRTHPACTAVVRIWIFNEERISNEACTSEVSKSLRSVASRYVPRMYCCICPMLRQNPIPARPGPANPSPDGKWIWFCLIGPPEAICTTCISLPTAHCPWHAVTEVTYRLTFLLLFASALWRLIRLAWTEMYPHRACNVSQILANQCSCFLSSHTQ